MTRFSRKLCNESGDNGRTYVFSASNRFIGVQIGHHFSGKVAHEQSLILIFFYGGEVPLFEPTRVLAPTRASMCCGSACAAGDSVRW